MAGASDEPGTDATSDRDGTGHGIVATGNDGEWVTEFDRTPETLREARDSLVPTARFELFGISKAALDRAAQEAHPHTAPEYHIGSASHRRGSRWLTTAGVGTAIVSLAFVAVATILVSSSGTPLAEGHLEGVAGFALVTSWGVALVAGISLVVQTALRFAKDRSTSQGRRIREQIVTYSDVATVSMGERFSGRSFQSTYRAEIDLAVALVNRSSRSSEDIRSALRDNPLDFLKDCLDAERRRDADTRTAGERQVLHSLARHLADPRMGPAIARTVRRIFAGARPAAEENELDSRSSRARKRRES